MDRKIPIYNIYNMLCYAWDVLEEKESVPVSIDESEEMINLFTKVLLSGTRAQIRKGLDRDYVVENDELRSIKGKIDFKNSISWMSFENAKSYCIYDEFSYDIINNQIIKSTLERLLYLQSIKSETRVDVQNVYDYFNSVSTISIHDDTFGKVKIDRNNHNYKILLKICQLIYKNLQINELTGEYEFSNFIEDGSQMAILFEKFVRNFYRKELPSSVYEIGSKEPEWDLQRVNSVEAKEYLPKMKTDISVISEGRNLIIDTKYYQNILRTNQYDTEKLHSGNLYQLFSYIKNTKSEKGQSVEGMLLYPTIDKELDLEYTIQGHKMSIRTLNLNSKDWGDIKDRLMSFVE